MSTDRADPQLRIDAGTYEDTLVGLLLVVQFALGAMIALVTVGWLFFTLNAAFDPNRSVWYFSEAIPLVIAMAAALYALSYLYEK
ncbi:hypothetical protein ACFO5R_17125 [Halosolutus amylolyticus]|uniref:Uncharacterized protein n=1 Tax=Halosolutus amylolyticus TaxID=2932267 RepID=A0ABD5PSS7_9EURY|nr:hypothetical protein [Halosolutus amylolyticus]